MWHLIDNWRSILKAQWFIVFHSTSSSSIELVTWKSLLPQIRLNSENFLTRTVETPRAWVTCAPGYASVLLITYDYQLLSFITINERLPRTIRVMPQWSTDTVVIWLLLTYSSGRTAKNKGWRLSTPFVYRERPSNLSRLAKGITIHAVQGGSLARLWLSRFWSLCKYPWQGHIQWNNTVVVEEREKPILLDIRPIYLVQQVGGSLMQQMGVGFPSTVLWISAPYGARIWDSCGAICCIWGITTDAESGSSSGYHSKVTAKGSSDYNNGCRWNI
jgi:hypothetical protein